ncbi:MAG: hypothetical protein H6711_23350 [Myxococcales bacterium]|nr:hypothetical protein [Myxococcales bacterium]
MAGPRASRTRHAAPGRRALLRVALACALALACTSHPPPRDPDPAPGEGPLLLAFERGGCYGFCPVYWIRVAEDGALLYEGQHFVVQVGRRRGQLSPEALVALRRALADADLFALADRYDRVRYRDLPALHLTYREGGREKTIYHHLGDNGTPAVLLELEEAIDRIVGSERWIGSEAERDRLSGI